MFGFRSMEPTGTLLSGLIYQPYLLSTMVVAAVVVWGCPQTWDWTRRLTPTRTGLAAAALVASLALLSTQAYNPFIYFIF